MAKKNNIGLGLAALAVGAGAVAAVTKGHKAEVKKEERKAAVKAAKQDYRNTELGRYDKNSKGIYYSNGNYEAFARPKKPAGVDEKNAYIVGSGLASLAAACFLVRDGQMPGSHIHILEAMDIAGGACDGIYDATRGYVMRGGREMENHFECLWDLFRSIPSIETPGVSVLDEYYWLNKHDPNYSLCRATVNRGKDAHTDGKFNLSQKNSLVFSVEHIQLNKKSVFFRDHIAVLGNEDTVCFRLQMLIGFSGERKIIFFTAHETFGFVSKKIVIILPADADNRGSAKIPLLNPVAGIGSQILRKVILPDQKFTFNLHNKKPPGL